jgi:hypothetical protein
VRQARAERAGAKSRPADPCPQMGRVRSRGDDRTGEGNLVSPIRGTFSNRILLIR